MTLARLVKITLHCSRCVKVGLHAMTCHMSCQIRQIVPSKKEHMDCMIGRSMWRCFLSYLSLLLCPAGIFSYSRIFVPKIFVSSLICPNFFISNIIIINVNVIIAGNGQGLIIEDGENFVFRLIELVFILYC